MKRVYLSLLIVFAFINVNMKSFAQKTVVNETSENLGGSVNPAFSVFIENADYKTVLKSWKALFEDHRGKIETSKKDVNISNTEFPMLSSTPIAVFSRITEDKLGVKLIVAFNKEGQYVCTKYLPSETEIAKKIVYDFAVSVKKGMVQAELDEASKLLDNLRDKNKDLLNDKSGMEKDIQSYNKKINKIEVDLVDNSKMTAEEKAKKEKDVQNYKKKITELESNIDKNVQQQTDIKTKIENQVKVVEDLKIKLDAVD